MKKNMSWNMRSDQNNVKNVPVKNKTKVKQSLEQNIIK
jgi:hypothetical protein